MLERAFEEAAIYGIECPDGVETVQDIAAAIVDGFERICMDDIASYWRSNFIVHGIWRTGTGV